MTLKALAPWALAGGLVASAPASALNIVLTNDDSWSTENVNVMADALRAQGHDVIMSTPCTQQSGKGGAMSFLKPVHVGERGSQEYCVGDTDETVAFEDFVEGTPVMAVLHGIDVAAQQIWGAYPDLVISGPNEGNNLGYVNNNSGTLGATMVALARGIPAIAVSAADGDASKSEAVAAIVVDIVEQLEANRAAGEALLPPFMGLNVNTPGNVLENPEYRFTDVAWWTMGDPMFTRDMSQDELAMSHVAAGIEEATGMSHEDSLAMAKTQYAGKPGLSFSAAGNLVADDNENGEARVVYDGYVAISTIDGHIQASRAKVALTRQKLKALTQ
eukprot:TRINITY_DN6573_c0_g1_i1.p2 TRINITY_DN6573_c0_g1~~TRINITY_DN6573_c0_g1_i1.p2  ORF type:complete len:331 (-),score=45.24 TRINITY_DN6573_c0_g1_i1:1-993(-)